MVKSVLGVNHQGLRDWIVQRLSAILMAIYVFGLVYYLVFHPQLSFAEWRTLFSHVWVKVATLLMLASLLYHAWIGMWTIFTDYIKSFILRAFLNFIVLLTLFACFFWGLVILWSV